MKQKKGLTTGDQASWKTVDAALRSIATRRGALDADELSLLIDARRLKVHRHLGHQSLVAYVEQLGYTRRAAKDRVRIAEVIDHLPALRGALRAGTLSISVLRELVRVVTPETEEEWLESAAGKTAREVERLVRGASPGDRPGDPKLWVPTPGRHAPASETVGFIRYVISPETDALVRLARSAIAATGGGANLSDDEVVRGMAQLVLMLTQRTHVGPQADHACA